MENLVKNDLDKLDQKMSEVSGKLSSLIKDEISKVSDQNARTLCKSYEKYGESLIFLNIYIYYVDCVLRMFKKIYDHPSDGSVLDDRALCATMEKISSHKCQVFQNHFTSARRGFVSGFKKYSQSITNTASRRHFLSDIETSMKDAEGTRKINPKYFKDRHLSIMSIWEKASKSKTISDNQMKTLGKKLSVFGKLNLKGALSGMERIRQELEDTLGNKKGNKSLRTNHGLLYVLNELIYEVENIK